jgi:hypothetical protein
MGGEPAVALAGISQRSLTFRVVELVSCMYEVEQAAFPVCPARLPTTMSAPKSRSSLLQDTIPCLPLLFPHFEQ